jgi:hypothetical protein
MQIKQIIKYQIEGYQFNTEEEAKQFIAKKEREIQLFKSNYEKLGGWKPENYSTPIPIKYTLDDNDEIKVGLIHWKKENDPRNGWRDLFEGMDVRYLASEIQLISDKEFLDTYLDSTWVIHGENFNAYLSAIAEMARKYPDYAQKVLDKLATTQFSPVVEYRD